MTQPVSPNGVSSPKEVQEGLYRLPYHWMPEHGLKAFERHEKQRIIYSFLADAFETDVHYLDVGCGDGRWTSDIVDYLTLKHAPDVFATGIDFSAQAIGFARLISPHINFEQHAGESLPVQDGSFDLATAIEVIEHVEDGSEVPFLLEIRRALRTGGTFVLTTPSWNLPLTQHHFRHYSPDRLNTLLEQASFEVTTIRGQSRVCKGISKKIRAKMRHIPRLWRMWKWSYREVNPGRALNLIVCARAR